MKKKTIAYILIVAAVIAAAYYLYKKKIGSASMLGAGVPDQRGAWAAEDDALYNEFSSMFSVSELNWILPYVQQAYETGSYGNEGQQFVSCNKDVMVAGKRSKAGSFACVIYGVIVNEDGIYAPVHYAANSTRPANIARWGGKIPSLFPPERVDTIWNKLSALKVKYGGLT